MWIAFWLDQSNKGLDPLRGYAGLARFLSLEQPEEKAVCRLFCSEHFWITSFRWGCILAGANDILNSLQKLCLNVCVTLIILSLVLVCPKNANLTGTCVSAVCLAISITGKFRLWRARISCRSKIWTHPVTILLEAADRKIMGNCFDNWLVIKVAIISVFIITLDQKMCNVTGIACSDKPTEKYHPTLHSEL